MNLPILLFCCGTVLAANIDGTVADSVTGGAVTGATVRLLRIRDTHDRDLVAERKTDASGRYRFDGVAPGLYAIAASSKTHVDGEGDGWVRTVRLESSKDSTLAALFLIPLARLSGRVSDDVDKVAAGATIVLHDLSRGAYITTKSDSNGNFGFSTLLPGRYLLAALPNGFHTWPLTWFPGVGDRASAARLDLGPGTDNGGYRLRVVPAPARRVRGIVLDENTKPAPRVTITMQHADLTLYMLSADSDEAGKFEFHAAREGRWHLIVGTTEHRGGFAEVQVGTRDIDGVEVTLERAFNVSVWAERPEVAGPNKTGVELVPLGTRSHWRNGFFDAQGKATIEAVFPGPYYIRPLGAPNGSYVASVLMGDSDILGEPVVLRPWSPPLRIVYQTDPAVVSGAVEKCSSSIVLAVPRDERLWLDAFIRTARCDETSRFTLRNMRPGAWSLWAFDRVDWAAIMRPEFLRSLPAGAELNISRSQFAVKDLSLTKWPGF